MKSVENGDLGATASRMDEFIPPEDGVHRTFYQQYYRLLDHVFSSNKGCDEEAQASLSRAVSFAGMIHQEYLRAESWYLTVVSVFESTDELSEIVEKLETLMSTLIVDLHGKLIATMPAARPDGRGDEQHPGRTPGERDAGD